MTPNQLDDLFRAGSDRGAFAPQPGEWEEMAALLDADERRGGWARRIGAFWLTLFALLIAGGTYGAWYFGTDPGLDAEERATSAAIAERAPSNLHADAPASKRQRAREDRVAGTVKTAEGREGAASHQQDGLAAHATRAQMLAHALPTQPDIPGRDRPADGGPPPADGSSVNAATATREAYTADVDSIASMTSEARGIDEVSEVHEAPVDRLDPSDPISGAGLAATTERTLRALPYGAPQGLFPWQPAAATTPPVPALKSGIRVSWEASVREDLTTVGLSREVRSATRVGLAALVAIAPRVRLRGGLTYGSRRYAAQWRSFADPQGVFDGGPRPSLSDGSCRLLEAPITLNFHPSGLARSGWFVGGGLRLRFVLDESLDFSYGDGVEGELQHMQHDVRRFDIGAGELAGGYRFVTSRRFAWTIGPALEIPLSGIGYGEVDVYTLGARVGFELR